MKPLYKEIGRQQQQQRHTNFRNTTAERLGQRFGYASTARMLFFYPISFDTQLMPGQIVQRPVRVFNYSFNLN